MFLECHSSKRKMSPQTKCKLSSKRPFYPLARIALQQESEPLSYLFMSMRMQKQGRGQGRISLWRKKKAAAPFLKRCCYGPAAFTTDGRRVIPAPGSEAVHSSIPFAFPTYLRPLSSAQAGCSPQHPTDLIL